MSGKFGLTKEQVLRIALDKFSTDGIDPKDCFVQQRFVEDVCCELDLNLDKETGLYLFGSVDVRVELKIKSEIYPAILPYSGHYELISLVQYTRNGIVYICRVGEDSPWVQGHFLEKKVVPGTAMIEASGHAIALSIVMDENISLKGKPILTGVDSYRPLSASPIKPGDVIEIRIEEIFSEKTGNDRKCRITTQKEATGYNNGKPVFKVKISGTAKIKV